MAQQSIVNYFLPPRIEFGVGAIKNLGVHVAAFGGRKPMVITDTGIVKAGILSRTTEVLTTSHAHAIFDAIAPNPTDLSVLDGVSAYQAEKCDIVIAVGGGSVMDAAKAIRILTTHEPPLEPYYADVGGLERITDDLPPLICVPTTAGTGSEVSQGAVITDTSLNTTDRPRKRAIVTPQNMASLSLLDPELTVGMPPALTAATGMDAITHGIEAYVATKYHPIAEGVALQALKILGRNIRQAYHHGEDVEARGQMLIGASMAAFSFQKGLGAVHSLAHQVSTEAPIPHGVANAILLPHVMAFNLPHAISGYAEIASALGINTAGMGAEQAANAAIEEIKSLNRELNMPEGFGAMGLERGRLPKLAEDAMLDHCYKFNPRPCNQEDMLGLFEAAF